LWKKRVNLSGEFAVRVTNPNDVETGAASGDASCPRQRWGYDGRMNPPNPVAPESADPAVALTRAWVDHVVIGLNLCPFAKAPQVKGRVRYVLCEATEAEALLEDLIAELRLLAAAAPEAFETTLLIHPRVLTDFADYNDFLAVVDGAIEALELDGLLQVASFHPDYQFAGTTPDDVSNATNRSPHPMLHLIHEHSIARAAASFPDASAIFEANIATMHRLGAAGLAELRQRCRDAAEKSALAE
jgi:hypothetical protein